MNPIDYLPVSGSIALPERRYKAGVTGLSGAVYLVEVTHPAETVHIAQVQRIDSMKARVTLDDDRHLDVNFIGSIALASTHVGNLPRIDIATDDMAPDAPLASGHWRAHWNDKELDRQAHQAAVELAQYWLDWNGEAAGGDRLLRRQSLLHHELKAILEETGMLRMPPPAEQGVDTIRQVASVSLRRHDYETVPDVLVHLADGTRLHIEVTVDRRIAGDRLAQVRNAGLPALEIDFYSLAGFINRDQFSQLLASELTAKRWLVTPGNFAARGTAEQVVAPGTPEYEEMRRTPASQWATRFLAAAAELERVSRLAGDDDAIDQAQQAIRQCAAALHIHGFTEADTPALYEGRESLIMRLIALRAAAKEDPSALPDTLDSIIFDASLRQCSWHTVFLIALKVWNVPVEDGLAERVNQWRLRVKNSIQKQEPYYLRDTSYDALLSLLFPDLASGLAHPFGKLPIAKVETPEEEGPEIDNEPDVGELSADYFSGSKEKDLEWVHPLEIRREIAKTVRAHLIVRDDFSSDRDILNELIDMPGEMEPWRFAQVLRTQLGLGRPAVLKYLGRVQLIALLSIEKA